MGHTIAEKDKLLVRVRLLKEQLAELDLAFRSELKRAEVLHLVTQSRGLINTLVAEVVEDHIRFHVLQDTSSLPEGAVAAAEDLIGVVHDYVAL